MDTVPIQYTAFQKKKKKNLISFLNSSFQYFCLYCASPFFQKNTCFVLFSPLEFQKLGRFQGVHLAK